MQAIELLQNPIEDEQGQICACGNSGNGCAQAGNPLASSKQARRQVIGQDDRSDQQDPFVFDRGITESRQGDHSPCSCTRRQKQADRHGDRQQQIEECQAVKMHRAASFLLHFGSENCGLQRKLLPWEIWKNEVLCAGGS